MFRKKTIKTPRPEDYLRDAEVSLNVAPNALTEVYCDCKSTGIFTAEHHARFIKEGLNVLIAIAGDKNISMAQAKAEMLAGSVSFSDVESAISSLGSKGNVVDGLSELGGTVKMIDDNNG